MSNDRYERIRQALAMEPTPGPWEVVGLSGYGGPYALRMPHRSGRTWYGVEGIKRREDAEYFVACDPDTIRALLEERDALAAALAATEAARDGYRDDAHQLHAALVRMVAQYESEFDHEDTHKFRPQWLREALEVSND